MLAVVVQVVDERYALAASSIVEVVPRVELSVVPRMPRWHAGLLAYRGSAVPVIDLNRKLADAECPRRLGNRVLVIEHVRGESGRKERIGLLVEQVLDVRSIPAPSVAQAQGLPTSVASLAEGELLQMLDLRSVIDQETTRTLTDGR